VQVEIKKVEPEAWHDSSKTHSQPKALN